jgi:hypothetical protein
MILQVTTYQVLSRNAIVDDDTVTVKETITQIKIN